MIGGAGYECNVPTGRRAGGAPRGAVRLRAALVVVGLVGVARPGRAQYPASDSLAARPVLLGTYADVRARDARLVGAASPSGMLLRSASSSGSFADPRRHGVRVLAPDVRAVWNDALPFSMNDASLWAGRGWSALARAGIDIRRGRVRALLLPELAYAENRAFDVAPNRRPGRSAFGWPWSDGRSDIDLPSRFGAGRWRLLSPGQSAVTVDVGPLVVGAATENDWWGPGVRNALVLSNNAEGFPHALVRTRAPIRTRFGEVEARWQLGVLTPSLYVDTAVATRWRAISAAAATLRPAAAPDFVLGVARAVVSEVARPLAAGARALDAVARWSATPADTSRRPSADQYGSLFARWHLAAATTEVYAEWGRQGVPRSLREFLVAPHDGGALTLGVQALPALDRAGRTRLRVHVEATSVEQSIAFRDRPTPPPFYAGLATRDGYTYRGQVLGAAIGPGSSAQWLSTDVVRLRGELGIFLGRIRWNNDALYAQANANFFRHDVSTFAGARGARRLGLVDVAAELSLTRRYNYLFQNGFVNPGGRRTVDVSNVSASLSVTPR